jgi:hypothetical protein
MTDQHDFVQRERVEHRCQIFPRCCLLSRPRRPAGLPVSKEVEGDDPPR